MSKQKEKRVQYEDKSTLVAYLVLRISVILAMIIEITSKDWGGVILCVLTLFAFMVPSMIEHKLNIEIPNALEIAILLFIYFSEILGELRNFYGLFDYWDTMLHTVNGFLMAAIGFSLVDILNRSERVHIKMTPIFVAFVAFCFSMTIGILWEFFEYGIDTYTFSDMQKDEIITNISSYKLNDNKKITRKIQNIKKTEIVGIDENGQEITTIINGGYLDVGLQDTMKDLIVNCIGAGIFSLIGLGYLYGRGDGQFVTNWIPVMKTPKEEIKKDKQLQN